MKTFLQKLKLIQVRFENWFNARFGWFFTNGNKTNEYSNSNETV